MDNSIDILDKQISKSQFKEFLLKRNKEWIKKKDGSSIINGSLRAVVLGCIDSRVPIEKIFQAKPGELLVLKNAGNIITLDVLRSILVAIYELDAKFIVIMGHTECGMAILDNENKIDHLKEKLGDKLLETLEKIGNKDPLDWFGFFNQGKWNENAKEQAKSIQKFLDENIPKENQPEIITMLYNLESGEVEFI
ncbi:carbonic anhydrase [Promethearchaeum syntrophicum]|uniref:Carbonic anhydrase n=1 Tax=Promethearchaeum syntrophicum TaxID=2594042 RepID=A0A5B9D7D2_9ARCH|nr:carbonic anhydrase [Candidatus Prometheoarchaeum syntrophicum]QEE14913.1 carbonic anhydrase [Candidatus Prometheoarchaeum syntrophicum]